MAAPQRGVRQNVRLESDVARRVQALSKERHTSANRIIVDLIESGLEAMEREKAAFLDLAERLAMSTDRAEQKRLKEELVRMTFVAFPN
jgi:predicted LPLAT superfamily acyltransferase